MILRYKREVGVYKFTKPRRYTVVCYDQMLEASFYVSRLMLPVQDATIQTENISQNKLHNTTRNLSLNGLLSLVMTAAQCDHLSCSGKKQTKSINHFYYKSGDL